MNGKVLRNEGESRDPLTVDIPATVDLQAVVNILKTVYPKLDPDEIRHRLLQVMQRQPASG